MGFFFMFSRIHRWSWTSTRLCQGSWVKRAIWGSSWTATERETGSIYLPCSSLRSTAAARTTASVSFCIIDHQEIHDVCFTSFCSSLSHSFEGFEWGWHHCGVVVHWWNSDFLCSALQLISRQLHINKQNALEPQWVCMWRLMLLCFHLII